MLLVPYHEAIKYIKEADILLFRGRGLISWLIKRYASGTHSHAAIAHWDNNNLACVEFREFRGGRSVSLKTQIAAYPNEIDVFRAVRRINYNEFAENDPGDTIDSKYYHDKSVTHIFDDATAKKVGETMLKLTGLPYGWKNIWKLGKHYLPFARLAKQNMKDSDPINVFVCSTAVAYAFRINFVDPVPYLADSAVAPADLARSPLFKYQFTINKDW